MKCHRSDVLYDVDRHVLASLLAVTVGPSLISTADFERRCRRSWSKSCRTPRTCATALRQSLTRRLLDDPVVYLDELTDAELAYLFRQRTQITGRITTRPVPLIPVGLLKGTRP